MVLTEENVGSVEPGTDHASRTIGIMPIGKDTGVVTEQV
jgi:hypothetical protein